MLSHSRLLVAIVAFSYLVCQFSAQEAQHLSPRSGYAHRSGKSNPRFSRFNTATQRYEPVAQDSNFFYYRINFKIDFTSADEFVPREGVASTLRQTVASGEVFDSFTMIQVGTVDAIAVTVKEDQEKEEDGRLTQLVIELGPRHNDCLAVMAATDRRQGEPIDADLIITGGSQQFNGASGQVAFNGTSFYSKEDHNYVAQVYVPKFKDF